MAKDQLAAAWPSGVPAEELAFLLSLTGERRETVLRRLRAVMEMEAGSRDLAGLAISAGVGRTAFYKLRRDWAARRSLRSLAPFGRDRPAAALIEPAHRPGEEARRQAAERTAAVEAIRADPAASNGGIATIVAARTGSGLDRRTLVAIARRERRLLHFSPTLLLGVYGRSLAADVSAIDLSLTKRDGMSTAIVALVMERSTGLVFGHAVGVRDEGVELQRAAAGRAIDFLSRMRADVPVDTSVTMNLVVGPGPAEQAEDLAATGAAVLGERLVEAHGRLRFGRRAASVLGRIGRFRFLPAATMPKATELEIGSGSRPPMSQPEADALLSSELDRHNRSAIDALGVVGLVRGGEQEGAIARLLARVFRPPA